MQSVYERCSWQALLLVWIQNKVKRLVQDALLMADWSPSPSESHRWRNQDEKGDALVGTSLVVQCLRICLAMQGT